MRTIDDAWYALRARAGLDDVRLHDLRHTCATLLNFYEDFLRFLAPYILLSY